MPSQPKSPLRKPDGVEIDEAADELQKLAGDPELIPGIYNYCDRWCERCSLTARCLTFKMEQRSVARAGRKGNESRDSDAVWEQVALNFAVAGRLLEREARNQGLDLDAIKAEVAASPRPSRRERRAHPIVRAATKYREAALPLLERLRPELTAIGAALETEANLGVGQPEATALELKDALAIVQWYLFFIEVKFSRALFSQREDAAGEAGFRSDDGDGSAKIALIAVERSIGAWLRLRQHLPGMAGEILDLLVQLEKVRRAANEKFPHAWRFKRPGFD